MEVLEFKQGKIEYRMPTIPEGLRLMGKMGINAKDLENPESLESNEFELMAGLIDNMECLIGSVDVKVGDNNISEYRELLSHFEMMEPLGNIAGKVMETFSVSEEKKQ